MADVSIRADPATSIHHRGWFAPVFDEVDLVDLPVRGTIPEELEGTFARNGPNPEFVPIGSFTYPFDGDGMIHAVTFEGGRVRYRNRWVVTRGLAAERRAGRALYGGYLTPIDPDPATVAAGGDPNPCKDVANTNIVRHAGRLLALWEGGLPYELSSGFGTVGEYDFDGRLPASMGAHPKLDPIWDELVFLRYDVVPPYLVLGTVDSNGRLSRTEPIDVPDPVLIHDFAVTSQHVVIFDSPAVFDITPAMQRHPVLEWREERGTRIGVMPRDGGSGDVVWIPCENRFAMHVLNGYSERDEVVIDYVHQRRFELGLESASDNHPHLHRITIDVDRRSVKDERLDPRIVGFPRIDERRVGLRHRFGYLTAVTRDANAPHEYDALVRLDLEHGTSVEHRFPFGTTVGEAVFVPRPGGRAEDDGWLLAYVYDRATDTSALVVLAADHLDEAAVATISIPRRVPAGLHGTWLPA